jgi:hypothetical protein
MTCGSPPWGASPAHRSGSNGNGPAPGRDSGGGARRVEGADDPFRGCWRNCRISRDARRRLFVVPKRRMTNEPRRGSRMTTTGPRLPAGDCSACEGGCRCGGRGPAPSPEGAAPTSFSKEVAAKTDAPGPRESKLFPNHRLKWSGSVQIPQLTPIRPLRSGMRHTPEHSLVDGDVNPCVRPCRPATAATIARMGGPLAPRPYPPLRDPGPAPTSVLGFPSRLAAHLEDLGAR